jgi:hypothetical protein
MDDMSIYNLLKESYRRIPGASISETIIAEQPSKAIKDDQISKAKQLITDKVNEAPKPNIIRTLMIDDDKVCNTILGYNVIDMYVRDGKYTPSFIFKLRRIQDKLMLTSDIKKLNDKIFNMEEGIIGLKKDNEFRMREERKIIETRKQLDKIIAARDKVMDKYAKKFIELLSRCETIEECEKQAMKEAGFYIKLANEDVWFN